MLEHILTSPKKISANVIWGKNENGEEKKENVEEERKRKDKELGTFSVLAITLRYDLRYHITLYYSLE
jgi:hypothetical protein